MSMTIEEAIRHYEESERINTELAKNCVSALAKNHNLENAEKCKQMIAWLRELQERRKAPEIVRCGECKHASTDATCCLVCNREGMGLRPYHVHSDDYCSYAERRTE